MTVPPDRASLPTYVQLLETNNLMQNCGDETYWLCLTRTVQESKLFPVSPYILLSYLNAFYRYPGLLRKIEAQLSAEEIADRSRSLAGASSDELSTIRSKACAEIR